VQINQAASSPLLIYKTYAPDFVVQLINDFHAAIKTSVDHNQPSTHQYDDPNNQTRNVSLQLQRHRRKHSIASSKPYYSHVCAEEAVSRLVEERALGA
jgi:hypothetical protein